MIDGSVESFKSNELETPKKKKHKTVKIKKKKKKKIVKT
jgi:hypothetical protein